ncbi:MAG: PD-(D/E)XK nuclease family protein [candidate division WOR-3 bacterium]
MDEKVVLLEPRNFLSNLAEYLIKNAEQDKKLSNFVIILPNRRSGVYLRYFISQKIGNPVILPMIFSIDDFVDYYYENFVKMDKKLAEHDALYILYTLYKDFLKELDFWDFATLGRRIYNDFEELKIHRRTKEELKLVLHDLDLPENSKTKILLENYPTVYEDFYNRINELGYSTRSSRYFVVADRINLERDFPEFQIVLCPPYLLTESERLFLEKAFNSVNFLLVLQKSKFVLEEFTIQFGKDLLGRDSTFEEPPLPQDLRVELISTDDDISEIFTIADRLSKVEKDELNSIDTAIVLPDPSKLFPLIEFAIPEGIEFNVSMGYPLKLTEYFTFFKDLQELLQFTQYDSGSSSYLINVKKFKNFLERNIEAEGVEEFLKFLKELSSSGYSLVSDKNVEAMIDKLVVDENSIKKSKAFWNDFLSEFWNPILSPKSFSDFVDFFVNFFGKAKDSHFSFRIKEDIEGLRESLIEELLALKNSLLSELPLNGSKDKIEYVKDFANFVVEVIQSLSVPLKGTPLKGLQIIGFLETRLLSFKRVVILDVQEGVVTQNFEYDTLLPFGLRSRLNLSDVDSKNKLAKYVFFTLLQSSNDCTIVYKDSNFDDPSYLILILKEYLEAMGRPQKSVPHNSFYNIISTSSLRGFNFEGGIKKNSQIIEKLRKIEYSYSHLETYLECPVKFALTYVFGFREELEDEYDNRVIGNVIHEILQKFFAGLDGEFKGDEKEKNSFSDVAREVLEKQYPVETPRITILKTAITERLWVSLSDLQSKLKEELSENQIGDFDRYYTEKKLDTKVELGNGITLNFTGKIDRIDLYTNGLVIIDYKSGRSVQDYQTGENLRSEVDELESQGGLVSEIIKKPKIQLLVYLWLWKNSKLGEVEGNSSKRVFATIFPLRGGSGEKPKLVGLSEDYIFKNTDELIKAILREILNPDVNFYLPYISKDKRKLLNRCKNCAFKVACNTFNML